MGVGLVALAVGLGCGMPVVSEEEQLIANVGDLGGALSCPGTPPPVLVGVEVRAAVSCFEGCPTEQDPMACFSTDLERGDRPDTYRYRFDQEGPAIWRFDAVPCPANALGYRPVDDRFVFDVIGPDEVVGRAGEPEVFAEAALSPGPRRAFPDDWRQPEGEPWQLVVDRPFAFVSALVTAEGRPVGVPSAARFSIQQDRGRPVEIALADARSVHVIPREVGATATVWFSHAAIPGERWPLAEVVGVPEASVVSLEVVAAYAPAGSTGAPLAARAIARDARGELVWGAPIAWSIEGEGLSLERPSKGDGKALAQPGVAGLTAPEDAPSDYASIRVEEAALTTGPHRGRLTASLGGLTADTDLAWTVPDGGKSWPWDMPMWYCPSPSRRGAPALPVLGAVASLAVCGGLVWLLGWLPKAA